MAEVNPRFDQYIEKAQPFAKPILERLRKVVHEACPDVKETIKWGMPHFEYGGSILCHMASFKQHAIFGFRNAHAMKDPHHLFDPDTAMGHFGRISNIEELPSDKIIVSYIKEAMKLNEAGVKPKIKAKSEQKLLVVPEYFTNALSKNKKALKTFEAFPYSHKKEYVQWIIEAKSDDTRQRRIETAVEWLSEGKSRNWKYERKKS